MPPSSRRSNNKRRLIMKTLTAAMAIVPMIALNGAIAAAETKGPTKDINPKVLETIEYLVNKTLSNAILITAGECAQFGKGWRPYGRMNGRFPLAAGKGKDDRGEVVDFSLGSEGGEYQHQLSEGEMPTHKHAYKDRTYSGGHGTVDYGDDRSQDALDSDRTTAEVGGNLPHNNMPPYLVLSFCHHKP